VCSASEIPTYVCVCVCVCMYTCVYTYTHTNTQTHTHNRHTHIFTYIYIYIYLIKIKRHRYLTKALHLQTRALIHSRSKRATCVGEEGGRAIRPHLLMPPSCRSSASISLLPIATASGAAPTFHGAKTKSFSALTSAPCTNSTRLSRFGSWVGSVCLLLQYGW